MTIGEMMDEFPHPLIKYFAYSHLPPILQAISVQFHDIAVQMDKDLRGGSEKTVVLRKLLEAKDAAVRSAAIDGL
jgi:hypothetical protein